jgi:chromosome segregation ATPase
MIPHLANPNTGPSQLEDYKIENAKLHQLATNIQRNLEHYQQAIQQQQAEHSLLVDKQQTQFKQEIGELQRELSFKNNRLNELEKLYNQNNTELQQTKTQYQSIQDAYDKLTQQYNHQLRDLTVLQDRYEQHQKMLQYNDPRKLDQRI